MKINACSDTGSKWGTSCTKLESSAKDYPHDWPLICQLWNRFGGWRPSRFKFIIRAPLSEVEKLV